jgi:Protein of unknown function (DUF1524)/Protein of unknown function DUF262
MKNYLRASVATVEELFAQSRVIHLPWFQRAYAWREDNVQRLVTDLLDAVDNAKHGYGLGHIHLAGAAGAEAVALVDGQQRAITLTMLFAVLRDLATTDTSATAVARDAMQHRMHALIALDPTESLTSGDHSWRLITQKQMSGFFERYVLQPGATLVDPSEAIDDLNLAERSLISNRDWLKRMLGEGALTPAKRAAFTEYLLSRCCFVVVEVDDEDEAWAILGVEQTTRMPHDASEQAKIALVYLMSSEEQEQAGRLWEGAQANLGNERMSELLGHLRTMRVKKRSTKPLEGELQQLYAIDRDGLGFMNTALIPGANAMLQLDGRQVGSGVLAGIISGHIDMLSWLDHRLWVAPALAWLTIKGDQHRETEPFFSRLDRLAWMLRLASTDPTDQENRFIGLTNAVRNNTPVDTWPEFEINERTRDDALAIMRSRTFYHKHTSSRRLLRRLCVQMGRDPGVIDGVKVSIEHVLPRNPTKERQWNKDFKGVRIEDYTNRLGNLAVLTGKQNRAADTKDWPLKRDILKESGFGLSVDAARHAKWTPKTIEARTEQLIALLLAPWDIPVTPP